MDRFLMLRIITTYIVVLVLVSLGFFGVGALASAAQPSTSASLQDPDAQRTNVDAGQLAPVGDRR
jgi:hypothetical protein